jgi:hypothetical protein
MLSPDRHPLSRANARRNVSSVAVAALTMIGGAALLPAPLATAAEFSPQEQQIVGELPLGFGANSCATAVDPPPPPDALASLDCRGNSEPNGPYIARFTLYGDSGAATANFVRDINPGPNFAPTPCPGADGSPSNWNYSATPNQAEGQILCGTFQNNADVEWTRNSQNLVLDVIGNSDVNSLFTWWATYGNPKSGPGPTPNTAAVLGHI